jgi:hypothetical protein
MVPIPPPPTSAQETQPPKPEPSTDITEAPIITIARSRAASLSPGEIDSPDGLPPTLSDNISEGTLSSVAREFGEPVTEPEKTTLKPNKGERSPIPKTDLATTMPLGRAGPQGTERPYTPRLESRHRSTSRVKPRTRQQSAANRVSGAVPADDPSAVVGTEFETVIVDIPETGEGPTIYVTEVTTLGHHKPQSRAPSRARVGEPTSLQHLNSATAGPYSQFPPRQTSHDQDDGRPDPFGLRSVPHTPGTPAILADWPEAWRPRPGATQAGTNPLPSKIRVYPEVNPSQPESQALPSRPVSRMSHRNGPPRFADGDGRTLGGSEYRGHPPPSTSVKALLQRFERPIVGSQTSQDGSRNRPPTDRPPDSVKQGPYTPSSYSRTDRDHHPEERPEPTGSRLSTQHLPPPPQTTSQGPPGHASSSNRNINRRPGPSAGPTSRSPSTFVIPEQVARPLNISGPSPSSSEDGEVNGARPLQLRRAENVDPPRSDGYDSQSFSSSTEFLSLEPRPTHLARSQKSGKSGPGRSAAESSQVKQRPTQQN